MNTKRFLILLILAVFVSTNACDEGLLDLENPNNPVESTFWSSQADAESGLTAVYHQLYQAGTYARWIFFRYDLTSDEGYSISPWTELADWTRFNYVNYNFWEGNGNMWRDMYKGVFRANQVLTFTPDIEFDDANRKNEIIGEASFLRALYHFNLAIMFEDVPVITELQATTDKPTQNTQEEVWQQVIADLEVAINNLPSTWSDSEKGRATKGAAYALLAKVHMQRHDWTAAKTALDWLVTGEGANIYGLVDNYQDNFQHSSENNIESVFEVQYSDANRGGKGDAKASSLSFERPQFFAPRGIGWSDGQSRPWLIEEYKKETNLDGGLDTRLKWSLYYREMGTDFADNDLVYGRTWQEDNWGGDVFIRKYSSSYFRDYEDYFSPNNFRVIRYADVLLLYAEVINEISGPAQAAQYVDQVRQRPSTNLPTLANSIYADALTSKDAFRKRLQMERSLELNHEGVRWMDLKRWGLLDDQAGIDELKQRDPDFNNFVIGRHHRMPIPQSEVENNPNLNQHAEY